ncbi:MAG: hypothetical protein A2X81_17425 [Desulfobacterales bacterium GWB2_56_26]|nr:MAG: hypothetical protein A2X81_17425 [Desulfobacterales bacterium GWB2_56_26]
MKERREIILRSNCFKLLAGCLYEPDRDLLIEAKVCENLGVLLEECAPEAAMAASAMAAALQRQGQEQLSIDYAALFVGPFALIAAPYGSVYMDQGRRVMGDSTLGVLRFYQEAGLSVDVEEPADHVVVELEFLYYLTDREASALTDGREEEATGFRTMQARFFFTWLRPWIFDFCRSIREGSTNPFYLSLADCLALFMTACERSYATGATPGPAEGRGPGCCPS